MRVHDSPQPPSYAPGMDDLKIEGEIAKVDTDKRQVFGWASVTEINGKPVIDLQNDVLETYELEKAAYDYVLNSRVGGEMHQRVGKSSPKQVGALIESMVITPEKIEKMGLPPETPHGWWIGFKVQDEDVWQNVKKGKYAGFSIHGLGKRLEKSLDEIGKSRTITIPTYTRRDGTVVEEHQRVIDGKEVAGAAINLGVAGAAGALASRYARKGDRFTAIAYGAYALMMLAATAVVGHKKAEIGQGLFGPPLGAGWKDKQKEADAILEKMDRQLSDIEGLLDQAEKVGKRGIDVDDFDKKVKYFADSVNAKPDEFLERLGKWLEDKDEFTFEDLETFLETYEVTKSLLQRGDDMDTKIEFLVAKAKEHAGSESELLDNLADLADEVEKLFVEKSDKEEVSKETVIVEQYTRQDGTVVPRHERKVSRRAAAALAGAAGIGIAGFAAARGLRGIGTMGPTSGGIGIRGALSEAGSTRGFGDVGQALGQGATAARSGFSRQLNFGNLSTTNASRLRTGVQDLMRSGPTSGALRTIGSGAGGIAGSAAGATQRGAQALGQATSAFRTGARVGAQGYVPPQRLMGIGTNLSSQRAAGAGMNVGSGIRHAAQNTRWAAGQVAGPMRSAARSVQSTGRDAARSVRGAGREVGEFAIDHPSLAGGIAGFGATTGGIVGTAGVKELNQRRRNKRVQKQLTERDVAILQKYLGRNLDD